MNKDLILKNNDKVTFLDRINNEFTCYITSGAEQSIREFEEDGSKVLKVERPSKYETIYEVKEILDEKEKEYLSYVIRPFRDRVAYIKKSLNDDRGEEWIIIGLYGDSPI